jgi:hypothetical protein
MHFSEAASHAALKAKTSKIQKYIKLDVSFL